MAVELAVDRFLSLLGRSSLLPEEQVHRLLEEFGDPDSELTESGKIADELVSRKVLTEWQAGMLLQGKHRGFILGSYRMLRPLGRGGMGAVFLAEHQRMHRQCAIKVLPSEHATGETSLLDRFYREAQAVAALDHPNIVRAYDVNVSVENKRELHYLVMEYVEGQDLQQMVQERGGLPFREAAEFARQSAEGLAHAHKAGLVHRDIKPANLLVDTKGVVKVLDLGLARFFNDASEASLTQEMGETVLGTADYLAPEQALDSHNVDERADIYSLGQTFYFMLTGHPPFPQGTVAQRLMAHQMKAPEPITKDRPGAPAGLLAIIDTMIAKKPEDRYQTAKEVADALAGWLEDAGEGSGLLRRTSLLAGDSGSGISARREPTLPRSSYSEETNLRLAPVDDDFKLPSSKTKLPGARSDSHPGSSSGKLAPAGDDARSPPRDSGFDEDDEDDGEEYGLSGEVPIVAKPKAEPPLEVPAEPEEDDPFSAPIPAQAPLKRPAPASQFKGKKAAGKKGAAKKGAKSSDESVVSTLLDSPYFWIGIAVTVVLALGIAFAITRPPSTETARQPLPQPLEPAASEEPAAAPEAPTTAPEAPPEKPEEPAVEEPKPAEPGAEPKLPDDAPTPEQPRPGEREKPKGGGDQGKEPSGPAASPQAAEAKPPGPDAAKPKPPKEKADPPKQPAAEEKPAAAEPTPAELGALFAGVRKVSLDLTSADPNANSKINLMLRREAQTAVERIGATPTTAENASVLRLTLEATTGRQLTRLGLSGELACRVSDSEEVVVWKHERQIADIAPALLRRGTVHSTVRKGVDDFFGDFVAAHRKTTQAANAKKPAPK